MTTGGHPPPEYAQKSLYVQQPSLRAGVFMVHQHYGTQTVNRGAVMPGMLVKHKDGRYAHLAPNHLTEHARKIDDIFGDNVPNMSHSEIMEDIKKA
ncbi:TPA: hypothetical protein JLU58_004456 [Escherichia coli]|nr:hypothetical protein [Escherichia coli]